MSDSNKGWQLAVVGAAFAAVFIAAGIGAYFGSLYSPDHKHYRAVDGQDRSASSYQGQVESLDDLALIPRPVEQAIQNPTSYGGADREERDLAAQEGMAAWAFWMVVAAFGTLLVTFFGTFLIWWQVRLTRIATQETGKATVAMQRANSIAQDSSERQLRAYLGPEGDQISDLRIGGKGECFVKIYNRGATPAYNVRISHGVFLAAKEEQRGSVEFDKAFSQGRVTIGPQQFIEVKANVAESIDSETFRKLKNGEWLVTFCGFVIYKDAFGTTRRTIFNYYFDDTSGELPQSGPLIFAKKGNRAT